MLDAAGHPFCLWSEQRRPLLQGIPRLFPTGGEPLPKAAGRRSVSTKRWFGAAPRLAGRLEAALRYRE
jgi:hypothetical protein